MGLKKSMELSRFKYIVLVESHSYYYFFIDTTWQPLAVSEHNIILTVSMD